MDSLMRVLQPDERASLTLRALYSEYGYDMYKMSKFEEYDLYSTNKDFLVSTNIITFTDTDGKLMALKPDVTLSIVKNSKDVVGGLMKVYYDENVYRVSKGSGTFKEIRQAGIECIGEVDEDTQIEVLLLSVRSLEVISRSCALEISHLDIVSGVLSASGVSKDLSREIMKLLTEKNAQGIRSLCQENLDKDATALITSLATVYGPAVEVVERLDRFAIDDTTTKAVNQLKSIVASLTKEGVADKVYIDFSVINDNNYYNGLAFKGYVENIPTSILSGGQYDGLMSKMNRSSHGIGFAVYLDELNRL